MKAKVIHQARVEGKLVEFIKRAFDAAAPQPAACDAYYRWFIKHSYLLTSSMVNNNAAAYTKQSFMDTWRFIGGSPDFNLAQIHQKLNTLPDTKPTCFQLLELVLEGCWPPPGLGLPYRVTLGHVACMSEAEEGESALKYKSVIYSVSFDELHMVYASRAMPALFVTHGTPIKSRFLLDLFDPGAPFGYRLSGT